MAYGTLESGKVIDLDTKKVVENPTSYYNDSEGRPVYEPYGGTVGNPNGAPSQSAMTPRPVLNEYQNAQANYYNNLNREKPNEAAIRENVLRQQQARIDAINKVYDDELVKARATAQGRLGETRALGAARGVLGSEFGLQEKAGTEAINQQQEQVIQNQRQREITDVLDRVDTISREKYAAESAQVDKNNAEYLNFLGSKQNEARDTIKLLANSGANIEELNQEEYKKLIDASGYSPIQLDAFYNAAKPKASQVKYEYKELKDGTLLRTGDDGSIKELGNYAPPDDSGEWKIQQFDDGTVAWVNSKTKQFETVGAQGQYAKPEKAETDEDMLGGLSKDQRTSLKQIRSEVAKDPDVKEFATIRDAKERIDTAKANASPANDLALIFSYMKLLDPTSVVREGEFANAENSGSIPERIRAQYNKALEGERLTKEQREDFASSATGIYDKKKKNYEKAVEFYKKQAEIDGIPTDRVLRDLSIQEQSTATDVTPADLEELKKEFPDLTEEEILQQLGKTKDLSKSENGSQEIEKIANAIGQYESGGNYQARGPVVTSGQYKGERALGKYQIMPGNLPSWSKQAIGRVVTEQEFLANPKLQDQIAQYQMEKQYQKYGTVEDVASLWFTGQPLKKAGNAKDVLGTTAPKYVKNVVAIYNKS